VEVGREKRAEKEKNEEDKREERCAGFVVFFFSNSPTKDRIKSREIGQTYWT
jgi:hypothetical protein